MRYYRFRFSAEGRDTLAYQEVDSNGNVRLYATALGERFLPPKSHDEAIVADGKFQFPKWGKIDWNDVFNGDFQSGCWAIEER